MKSSIPSNSGLSEKSFEHIHQTFGQPFELTDVQYSSLEKGVALGKSMLVVSPTSTGKTHIGLWAMQAALENNSNVVYLVTHRALAKQKFEDFIKLLANKFIRKNEIILATGDVVIDGDGNTPSSPLSTGLIVATYEKYLALISSSGIPNGLSETVIVCDEVQLIGDKSRGEHVEILLTLLKNAGWKQLVALSAVLELKDATELANWLEIEVLFEAKREKHLQYEYWHNSGINKTRTDIPTITSSNLPQSIKRVNADSIIEFLINEKKTEFPIIVFCLRKADIEDLSQKYLDRKKANLSNTQLALDFDGLPLTVTNEFLAFAHSHRVTIHSGDLTDEEKLIVERKIKEKSIDIVFATTTLAAGVNFPFSTAIFSSYARWNGDTKNHEPIDAAEFHNMAGRVGRMGMSNGYGRVIFCEHPRLGHNLKINYLDFSTLPSIKPQIKIGDSERLILQLIASELCNSVDSLTTLLCNSYSGLWEQDNNLKSFENWPAIIKINVASLCKNGYVIEGSSGKLIATPVAKSVANSGLKPSTVTYILGYLAEKCYYLTSLLPNPKNEGNLDKFALLIFSACYSSPEFSSSYGKGPSRSMPWPLTNGDVYYDATELSEHLSEKQWIANVGATNSAKFALDWLSGESLYTIEKNIQSLTAGMLHENCRNMNWILQGLSRILTSACNKNSHEHFRPHCLRVNADSISELNKLPWHLRRLSMRLAEGLPDKGLWLADLNKMNNKYKLTRNEILSLLACGLSTPEQVSRGDADSDSKRIDVFKNFKPSPFPKANWLRDVVRGWKVQFRKEMGDKHLRLAKDTPILDHLKQYYLSLGDDFEVAFENLLRFVGIEFTKLDDKSKIGAPDYLIRLNENNRVIIELKTKQADNLVSYDSAVEVLAAATIHGYGGLFCITLCHPGVDPSVASVVADCGRLSVIESCDFAEGILRYYQGDLSSTQLYEWLTTPGQALVSDLPFKEY